MTRVSLHAEVIDLNVPFGGINHGLRTPNEDINQRYLKNWAGVADTISFPSAVPKNLGVGVNFRLFPLWASVVRE